MHAPNPDLYQQNPKLKYHPQINIDPTTDRELDN